MPEVVDIAVADTVGNHEGSEEARAGSSSSSHSSSNNETEAGRNVSNAGTINTLGQRRAQRWGPHATGAQDQTISPRSAGRNNQRTAISARQ